MRNLVASRPFHDVEGAGDIGVDIGAGVVQGIAHARLPGEMDDNFRLKPSMAASMALRSSSIASVAVKVGVCANIAWRRCFSVTS